MTEVFIDEDANEMHLIGQNFHKSRVYFGNYPAKLQIVSEDDDLLVLKVLPAHRVPLVNKVLQARPVNRVHQVALVQRARQVLPVQKVIRVSKALRAFPASFRQLRTMISSRLQEKNWR